MIIMKKRMIGVVSMAGLAAAYLLFRYPLFEQHGMKAFPLYLFLVGMTVIVITGLIRGTGAIPILTVVGYVGGFLCSGIFQYDYGEGLNNRWMIWMWCFVVAMVIGVVIQLVQRHRRQPG